MFKKTLILLIILIVALLAPNLTLAVNDVTLNGIVGFQLNTIDLVPVATTIYGQNGGVVGSLVVQTNYIDVNLDPGSSITFNATFGKYFSVGLAPLPAGVTIPQYSCLKDQITITSTAVATITLQVTSTAPTCPTGGINLIAPKNYSVTINSQASCTLSQAVTLNLRADDAAKVIVSNDPDFVGTDWQDFISPKNLSWTLTSGDGNKTVYVMYKSSSNTITDKISASINLNSSGCEAIPPTEKPQPLPGLSFNQLLKASLSTVYYYGADGKRHAFPDTGTYFSWYADFSGVKTISDAQLAQIPLGPNVTYKPGVKMLKVESDPKVYAVDTHGVLRWVTTEEVAIGLYGSNWASSVKDISVAFFINYAMGADITKSADFNLAAVSALAVDINTDKNY